MVWIIIALTISNVLLWYCVSRLHDLLTKTLKLVTGNLSLIDKIQNLVIDTDDKMIDLWMRHLEIQHGAVFEEGLKDTE